MEVFAQGLSFYKLWCVFIAGAVCGDLVETIFCRVKYHRWMCRSSFVYGHFNVVWAFAMVFGTFLYYQVNEGGNIALFFIGMIMGGFYEYVCSLITEKYMGLKFWDYSKFRFNWSGRINLLYCIYWGIITVFWVKLFFPKLENFIERIPQDVGRYFCNISFLLITINGIVSIVVLKRYVDRKNGNMSCNKFEEFLDRIFPNEKVEKIYPHMKLTDRHTRKESFEWNI